MNTFYSWNTKKVDGQYTWFVKSVTSRTTPNSAGQYADTVVIKTGTKATRAQAKGLAVKWARYLKASAK
jgi:hypothetical protein